MAKTKIIFDNDGVNIDSEDVAMRVMDDEGARLVRRYQPNADLPQDYIYKTYPGTSTDRIVDALIKKFDLPVEQIKTDFKLPKDADVPVALADLITLETNKRFIAELKAVPGTTGALKTIHMMFGSENVALMTTSRADRMDISLAHAVDPASGANAQLDSLFPKGAQRRSGYGHTNKYDEGFGALGWNPAQAIIVEDSLSGVTKAKAGREDASVIGTVAARFYTDKPAQAEALLKAGADIVISSMFDLPAAAWWLKDGKPETKPAFLAPVYFADPAPLSPARVVNVAAAKLAT
jgi:beta-phosphoglucomutase-like phosphatase (HAD superfamily)